MEEENTALSAELNSVREEFNCVEVELGKTHETLLELLQENCQQLIGFDNALVEKDKEIVLLKVKLQIQEIELARWKVSNLIEPAIQRGVAHERVSKCHRK